MGATKTGQFFSGSFFGILLWGTGILMSGFLPTFGDGIEFGYVSALSIFFPAVMWLSCVFTGIKTAKNGKKVFFQFVYGGASDSDYGFDFFGDFKQS